MDDIEFDLLCAIEDGDLARVQELQEQINSHNEAAVAAFRKREGLRRAWRNGAVVDWDKGIILR